MLEFSQEVIDTFLEYRQGPDKDEAGGILLGRLYQGVRVILDAATVPNVQDKAGRYYFDRSREAAQAVVNEAWRASNGEQNYLGEWHSHPVPSPVPSDRDRQMIRNMFHQTRMEVDFLILVVVGLEENWVGMENGRRLRKLKPFTIEPKRFGFKALFRR